MMKIFKKRQVDKSSFDFQTEVLERLDCIQKSQATSRQHTREIVKEVVREEIKSILNERNKKGWWQIA
jgi:predicted component of type VI protein secretion system